MSASSQSWIKRGVRHVFAVHHERPSPREQIDPQRSGSFRVPKVTLCYALDQH
jgi:hypothetical protein